MKMLSLGVLALRLLIASKTTMPVDVFMLVLAVVVPVVWLRESRP
jgi:hypothetical protein